MKKLFLLFFTLCAISLQATAQSRSVSGTVVYADDGHPIIGATIIPKGLTQGTITDIDGNFRLQVPDGINTLVVSYVGMQSQEVPVGNDLKIALQNSEHQIDEVVVTALGMRRDRKGLGYAAQDLKANELNKAGTTSLADALQGKLQALRYAVQRYAGSVIPDRHPGCTFFHRK